MSAQWSKWGWGLMVLAATTGAAWEIFADRAEQAAEKPAPQVAVETLLPADTVFYARHDGTKKHAAAWEHTAAHEALSAARVDELVTKLVAFLRQQAPGTFDPRMEALAAHLSEHGGSLAVSIPPGPPLPKATLVLHHAAKHIDLVSEAAPLLAENRIESETRQIEGREVHIAHLLKTPALDLAWWAEGNHLAIGLGVDPVQNVLAVASGKKPNITQHRLWSKDAGKQRVISSTAWVDARSLREKFRGFPIPIPEGRPILIGDALEILGLETVEELVVNAGYEGKALWSETRLNTTGERTGLLSVFDGEEITFEDLPPLPVHTNSFFAASMKPAAAYETLRRVIQESMAHGPEEAAKEVERAIDTVPSFLGFDLKTDLLDALGTIVVACDDPDQGFLGTGSTLIVQVQDAKKLRQTFEKIVDKLNSLAPNEEEIAKIHRSKKHGREIWNLEFGQVVQSLGIGIDDDWMVVALMPQPVEAFFLRLDGKLPSWKKEQLKEQGAPVIPEKFTSLGVSNPRVIYQSLFKLAPFGMSALVAGMKGDNTLPKNAALPWMLSDLPPAELIAGPLFPNVRTMTMDENGIRWTSHSSLPSLPVVGGPGGGNGALAGSIVTSLMLPAIHQSREAARRSQSKNNLKQLGLAMHNYHDVYNSFPAGTLPNEKLKPDERLSFFVELLPFIDQAALYQKIDKEGGWKEKDHREIMETRIPTLMNPAVVMPPQATAKEDAEKNNYALTHYVGLAGIGKDASLLPVTSNRAGVFGYNRKTRIQDITDGTSNTMMITEASKDYGAWGAGGTATIRSLTQKPYINGPDGIGGPWKGQGVQVLLCDGSVRFISVNIDPNTFEALTTIRGGEVIGEF